MDTLVLSQLLDSRREGGHSLEAWGERLGHPKVEHNEWHTFSKEMLTRCEEDTRLNYKVYVYLSKIIDRNKLAFDKSIDIEMKARWSALDMHSNGFKFNVKDARALKEELEVRLSTLQEEMRKVFPAKAKLIREVTPKLTKNNTISKVGISSWYDSDDYTKFSADSSFSLVEWVDFEPSSPKQIIDRLDEAGWKPIEKTKGHIEAIKSKDKEAIEKFKKYGYKVNEVNIATLPEDAPDACQLLIEFILLDARRRTLVEWLEAYNEETGRVHGSFNPLGTRSHRCSHSRPNMGNVATAKTIKYNTPKLRELAISLGGRMRSMWICDDDAFLVGCDMEGAHLRIFAHLIDDKEFTKALIEGSKENGTDPHSRNKNALGDICIDRDRAKTFIFTYLNGGSAPKVSEIFGCSRALAQEALDRFVRAYPGLADLKANTIPKDAARGYFQGIDGRYVKCDSEHLMIGMYLQNMESVLMKHAEQMWRKELADKHPGIRYKLVNWVHDEWVTEVYGGYANTQTVGAIQSRCITAAGIEFGLRCPMAGEFKVGKNWLEVH